MLSNTFLDIPDSETWLEYDPQSSVFSVKNATTIILEYVFDTATGTPHILKKDESIESINQNIYFKVRDKGDNARVLITKGVHDESVMRIVDNAGRTNLIGTMGEQWATDVKNDILAQFSYGMSTYELKAPVVANGGTVTVQADNLLTVSSGTALDGEAEQESFHQIRYRAGHTVLCQFTALFTDHEAIDCHQWIGLNDGQNGFAIGFIDGQVAVMRIRNGVHHHTFLEDFNGNIDMSKVNWDTLNVFRITFAYLGSAPIVFEMLEPDKSSYNTIHTINYHNQNIETHIELPYLPISSHVENMGNTTDVQIRSGSWQGGVMGFCDTCGNRGFAHPYVPATINTKTLIGATPVVLAGFKSVDTFQGFQNKIRSVLEKFSYTPYDMTLDAIVTVQFLGGATTTGGTYDDIDSLNSVLQINTTATGFTGGRVGLTMSVPVTTGQGVAPAQSTPADLDTDALQLFLDPTNEYVIIAFVSAGTASLTWDISWIEQF